MSRRPQPATRDGSARAGIGVCRTLFRAVGAVVLLGVVSPGATEAQQQLSRVQEIKAAVTFNLLKFVEWPSDDSPVRTMCVAPGATLGGALEALGGRQARGKQVEVRVLEDATESSGCHVLVLSAETLERERLDWDGLNRPELLTVGEGERFVREGGMVAMRVWQNRIQLQINLEAVEESGLRMSSQLLSLAEVVDAGENGG